MFKFKKTIMTAILMLSGLFLVTGCGTKQAITAGDFKTQMEANSYVVSDVTEQYSKYDSVKKVYVAASADYSYQIEFYQLEDEEYAIQFFEHNKSIFENSKRSNNLETNVSLNNYAKYTLTSNGHYIVVSRIDSTVIFVNAPGENKDAIKGTMRQLGY